MSSSQNENLAETSLIKTLVGSDKRVEESRSDRVLATAVSRIDNLEFLSDTVPKTKTYRQFKEEKAQEEAAKAASAAPVVGINGEGGSILIQSMMKNYQPNGANGANGANGVNGVHGPSHGTMPGPSIAHRSGHQRTHSHPDPVRDINMSG